MRIVDYQISKCRRRLALWQERALLALVLEVNDDLVRFDIDRAKEEHENIEKIKLRTRHVRGVYFNLNALSDHQGLKDFRFKKYDIGVLCERFDWPGVSARNKYRSDRITAMCYFYIVWEPTVVGPTMK